jgi:hypothetical protein
MSRKLEIVDEDKTKYIASSYPCRHAGVLYACRAMYVGRVVLAM